MEKRDLAIAWTSFEVRDLKRIRKDVSQGFELWQSSGRHSNWILDAHSFFSASFRERYRLHCTTKWTIWFKYPMRLS
jgi:hypothetical protein